MKLWGYLIWLANWSLETAGSTYTASREKVLNSGLLTEPIFGNKALAYTQERGEVTSCNTVPDRIQPVTLSPRSMTTELQSSIQLEFPFRSVACILLFFLNGKLPVQWKEQLTNKSLHILCPHTSHQKKKTQASFSSSLSSETESRGLPPKIK